MEHLLSLDFQNSSSIFDISSSQSILMLLHQNWSDNQGHEQFKTPQEKWCAYTYTCMYIWYTSQKVVYTHLYVVNIFAFTYPYIYRFLLMDQFRFFPRKLAPFRLLVDLATRTRKSWMCRDSTRKAHVATVEKFIFLHRNGTLSL